MGHVLSAPGQAEKVVEGQSTKEHLLKHFRVSSPALDIAGLKELYGVYLTLHFYYSWPGKFNSQMDCKKQLNSSSCVYNKIEQQIFIFA